MNTRLQVEHPVTELVTGIDLVEQMIRVAAGEKLKIKQSDVKLSGWAVESRIYAEDPYRNFLPSIGRLVKYRPPRESSEGGLTIRNDTGVTEGGEISLYYDPMIAKLVTHAPTREAAIDLQSQALDAFYIDGIRHNIPFLTALMQHPRWRKGNLSTGFIAEEFREGFKSRAPSAAEIETLAAVGAAVDHLNNDRRRHITGQMSGQPVRFAKRRVIRIGEVETQLDIAGSSGKPMLVSFAAANGRDRTLELVSAWWPGDPIWRGRVGDEDVSVQVKPILNGYELSWRGIAVPVRVYTAREAELAALMPLKVGADLSKFLVCPMPGLVKAISVTEGQDIKAGDPLAVVEAMKMENVLRAERDATVKKINARPGDSLAVDAVIMEFA
jgi:propionyl-CoA carboxylase alpha chain